MQDLPSLVATFGPTAGAVAAVLMVVWRGMLPYVRDTYLPARLKAQQDLATALADIGTIARESSVRLAGVETRLAAIQETAQDTAEDLSAVFAVLQSPRPSRSRAAGAPIKKG